jgi:hypothetical protein
MSDKFQIGIPDIVGCIQGKFFGIEFKSVEELSGVIPPKGSHPFTETQIKDLKLINHSGGVGIGVIRCGEYFIWVHPIEIDKNGRVNVDLLLEKHPKRLYRLRDDFNRFKSEVVTLSAMNYRDESG